MNPTAAVLIGVAATIAPMYLAKATHDEKEGVSAVGRGAMFAGLALGPSLGYLYARRPGYALVSAIGKGALLALALGLDARLEKQEMEQAEDAEVDGLSLGMVAALGVGVWDLFDLCLLPGHVREDNTRQSSMSIVPVVGTAQRPGLGMSVAATF